MFPLLLLLLPLCLCLWLCHGLPAGGRPWLDLSGASAQKSERQQRVVEAFLHGWRAYKAACWGKDEIRPVSRNCTEEFGGMGVQIVDALDSLLLMGLKEEYAEARHWVLQNFTAAVDAKANVFEVSIRVLGGLLSAHFLTKDDELLRRASDLGRRLLLAWREGPLPYDLVNLATGEVGTQEPTLGTSLSEVGTLQLEFKSLSAATGDPRFHWRAEHVMDLLGPLLEEAGGLLPIMLMPSLPIRWTNPRVTLGGRGDSFYEYLLKQWLLTNRTEDRFLRSYRGFVRAVRRSLVGSSSPSGLQFVREVASSSELASSLRPGSNETWDASRVAQLEAQGPIAFVLQVPMSAGPELETAAPSPQQGQEDDDPALPGQCASPVLEEEVVENRSEDAQAATCQESAAVEASAGSAEASASLAIGGCEEEAAGQPPALEAEAEAEAKALEVVEPAAADGEEVDEKRDSLPAWMEAETCEASGSEVDMPDMDAPQTCEANAEDPAQSMMKKMQEMLTQGGKMQLVYVVIPAMKMEEVCATAELLLARRWDNLHPRVKLIVPSGAALQREEGVRDAVAQMAGGQLAGQCQKWGHYKMDHLACFLPGLLALGVLTGAAHDAAAELELAAGLAEACARMWLDSPLGLAPESVTWNVLPGRPNMQVFAEAPHCSLRPETMESLWYLYLATGERKYQEWGWKIFEAIEEHLRVPHGGYSGVEDVREADAPRRRDRMETFVLSETFKYLYLLFADRETHPLDLTQVVFNTEGHPLPLLDPAWAKT